MVRQEVLDTILDAYYPECRYLQSAEFDEASAPNYDMYSKFVIPKTFYGEGSGHFNATEMMMCYNQMSYVFFTELFERGAVDQAGVITLDEFVEEQMNCLIAKMDNIRFKAPINPRDFSGKITLGKRRAKGKMGFAETEFSFYDDNGGNASGIATLVLDLGNRNS